MALDYDQLEALREGHPAWRLLASRHAALVASFLDRVFIQPNQRVLAQADLVEALEDELFALRESRGEAVFPKSALDYLNDWAGDDRGWLRKFYQAGSDEPMFDLSPATEQAIAWLGGLTERSFVGTESRLLTLFELLRQIDTGSETDPALRIQELEQRRAALDAEIERIRAGELTLLDATELRDRFQQFQAMARELLSDFRQVEHNFRALDRRVRERIALWEGGKGELLAAIMGERDAIADSDQGRSFHAFWDFLMSGARQEELSARLERVLALPAVAELAPDPRTRRIHYDWLAAGEQTQRTVAQLSQQLRRFLDDQAWLENRRILEILRAIEGAALAVRGDPPAGEFFAIDGIGADIQLPLERPLYSPALRPRLVDRVAEAGEPAVDASALYGQVVVDKAVLEAQVRQALRGTAQISLAELCRRHPLTQGLAELVGYLELADSRIDAVVDETVEERITWQTRAAGGAAQTRAARLPRVIFLRQGSAD